MLWATKSDKDSSLSVFKVNSCANKVRSRWERTLHHVTPGAHQKPLSSSLEVNIEDNSAAKRMEDGRERS